MQLEKHKAGVGVFIVTATALLFIGVILLGGEKYFRSDTEYVLYFDTAVNGLSIGAPVMMRGVPLGSVTRISLVSNASNENVVTPVSIRIKASNLRTADGEQVEDESTEQEVIRKMISNGLRAQLQTASLLTGQTNIQLDFYPESRARFRSPVPELEIPTIPSPIDTLQSTLRRMPIQQLLASVEQSLISLNAFFRSGSVERTFQAVEGTFTQAEVLLRNMQDMPPLIHRILAALAASSENLQKQSPAAVADLRKALQDFSEAARELHDTAATAGQMVAPGSPLGIHLNSLLRDGAAAARALRSFADTLERNPEAVLRGRQGEY